MNTQDIFDICLAKKLSGGSPAPTPTYEDKTLTPDFSNGDVIVNPDEGYDALSSVTIEKDTDLVAGNIKKDVEVFGITGTLATDNSKFIAMVERPANMSISDSDATHIASYAFYLNTNLVSVDFSSVIYIDKNAFQGCDKLTSITFPQLTTIYQNAFASCKGLTSVTMPNVTSMQNYAFTSCINLVSVSFPELTIISQYVFYDDKKLSSLDFPKVTMIGNYAFSQCSGLTSVSFPNVTQLGMNAFTQCTNLTSINFPKVTVISDSSFRQCSKLELVDFLIATKIASGAFQNCTRLYVMILRSETLCTLDYITAFTSTPFASDGTGGTLYVPQALIESYQSANNWSTILGYPNNQIKAIEGSIYE